MVEVVAKRDGGERWHREKDDFYCNNVRLKKRNIEKLKRR